MAIHSDRDLLEVLRAPLHSKRIEEEFTIGGMSSYDEKRPLLAADEIELETLDQHFPKKTSSVETNSPDPQISSPLAAKISAVLAEEPMNVPGLSKAQENWYRQVLLVAVDEALSPEIAASLDDEQLKGRIRELIAKNQAQLQLVFDEARKPLPEKINPVTLKNEATPLSNKVVSGVAAAGDFLTLAKVFDVLGHLSKMSYFSGVAHVAANIVEFLMVGGLYIKALVQRDRTQPLPPLSGKQRMAYLAVSIGLLASAIALPTLAGIFGATIASVSFVYTAVKIGREIYDNRQAQKEIKQLTLEDRKIDKYLNDLSQKITALNTEFETLTSAKKPNRKAVEHCAAQMSQLRAQYQTKQDEQVKINQTLAIRKQAYEKQGGGSMAKKLRQAGEVLLATAAVVGTALLLVFPPLGFQILATTAGVAVVGAVAGFVYWGVNKLINRNKSPAKTTPSPEHHHSSTAQVEEFLYGQHAQITMTQLLNETKFLERLDFELQAAVAQQDHAQIVKLFIKLASIGDKAYLAEKNHNPQTGITMKDYADKLIEFKEGAQLLKAAFVNHQAIPPEDKRELLQHQVFAEMMKADYDVDFAMLDDHPSANPTALAPQEKLQQRPN